MVSVNSAPVTAPAATLAATSAVTPPAMPAAVPAAASAAVSTGATAASHAATTMHNLKSDVKVATVRDAAPAVQTCSAGAKLQKSSLDTVMVTSNSSAVTEISKSAQSPKKKKSPESRDKYRVSLDCIGIII